MSKTDKVDEYDILVDTFVHHTRSFIALFIPDML